jgi:hypothetical protein
LTAANVGPTSGGRMQAHHRHAILALSLCSALGCRAVNVDPWRWARPFTAEEFNRSRAWGTEAVIKQLEMRTSFVRGGSDWFTTVDLRGVFWMRDANPEGYVLVDQLYPGDAELLAAKVRVLAPNARPVVLEGEAVTIETASTAAGGPSQRLRLKVPPYPAGTLLQLETKSEVRRLGAWFAYDLLARVPIEEYLLEVLYDPKVEIELLVYNPTPNLHVERVRDAVSPKVRLRARDLAPLVAEDLAPDPKAYAPWWSMRVSRQVSTNLEARGLDLWYLAFAIQTGGLEQESGPHLPSLDTRPDVEGCRDRRCQVARALLWLEQPGLPELPPAPAAEELQSAGDGQALPRARLLWAALKDAGLPVRWALASPRGSPTFDPKNPNPVALSDPLLYLPAVGDNPPMWIDPGCTYCGPGEVQEQFVGAPAVLGWGRGGPTPFTPTQVKATLPIPSQRTIRWRIQVDAAQNAAQVEVELAGRIRQEVLAKQLKLDDAASAQGVATWIKDRSPNASCSKVEPFPKSEVQPVRHLSCALPKLVRRDGPRWVVPLEMLNSRWDHSLLAERRRAPIEVPHSEVEVEELTLELPPGTRVVSTPKPRRVSGELFDMELKVQKIGDTLELRRTVRAQRGRVGADRYTQEKAILEEARALRGAEVILAPAGT